MASIQWTPPAGWVEETGAHVLMLAPCDCTATSTLVIGANAYTIVDGMGASFSTRGGVFATGALLEFVLDVDAKKAYLLSQAGLSTAPRKPKLLWSGSALPGSTLTAAGIAQYSVLLAVFSIYGADVPAILYNNANDSVTGWAANTIVENSVRYNRFVAARLNISDESAFVSDIFTTVTYTGGSNVFTEGGATSYPLTALYGMTLKSDIQEG